MSAESYDPHEWERAVMAALGAQMHQISQLTNTVLGLQYLVQVVFAMTREDYAGHFGQNVERQSFDCAPVTDEVIETLENFWDSIKKARARRLELEASGEHQDRLQKVEDATQVLSALMRVVYTAHPGSCAVFDDLVPGVREQGVPERIVRAYERFRAQVGEAAVELAKRRSDIGTP